MSTSMPATDILDRLHAALVRALREDRRDAFGSPVTVAEIYQDLIPYRLIRADLGFEMNADYEHTVLRLLSGERDLAELEPAEARKELEEELDSPNPNVGLFRKFAGCDVQLRPGRAGEEAFGGASEAADEEADPWETPAVEDAVDSDDARASEEVVEAVEGAAETVASMDPDWTAIEEEEDATPDADLGDVSRFAPNGRSAVVEDDEREEMNGNVAAGPAMAVPTPAPERPDISVHACAFCDDDLPPGRAVRFCPHCGADQMKRPCAACGETLERHWRFCISCGAEAGAEA